MASNISILLKFSDGTMTYLRDTVTLDTLTEIQTDASGILNITGDVSVGQAYVGKTATHALAKVVTDSASSGAFCYAAFYGPDGSVLSPIQGGGYRVTGLPKLVKPVQMTTGTVCKGDIFFGLAVDDTIVSMLNAQGSSYGQSLAGETVVGAYATYGATYGLADTGVADGIGGFFVESSTGQLKMLYSPGVAAADAEPMEYIPGTHRVDQNDTLTVRANV